MTLKSHGVAAACIAASHGFDSHQRLNTADYVFEIHLYRWSLNHHLAGRVLISPQLPVGTTLLVCKTSAARHIVTTTLRWGLLTRNTTDCRFGIHLHR